MSPVPHDAHPSGPCRGSVVLAAGTTESVALARELLELGWSVLASQATDIVQPWPDHPRLRVRTGPLDLQGWSSLLRSHAPVALVDAAHPFAEELRSTLREACRGAGVARFRLERPSTPLPPACLAVSSPADVVAACFGQGKVVVLATGSRLLPFFHDAAQEHGVELHARLCPGEIAEHALECGFPRDRVIWGRGVLDAPAWVRILVERWADALVTKESGSEGGVPAKIAAAAACRIPLVVLERPLPEPGGHRDVEAVVAALEKQCASGLPGCPVRT